MSTGESPREESELYPNDLKSTLYDRLQKKGLLNALKSQLRNFMVAELSKQHRANQRETEEAPLKLTLHKRIMDSLVYNYLCYRGCDYTVGVFLPEAKTNQREVLSREELTELLNLTEGPSSSTEGDDSVMQAVVLHLMRRTVQQVNDVQVQTEPEPLSFLVDKLSIIDSEFSSRHPAERDMGIEERLISYQRKIEQASLQKAQEELDRWRRLEIETIRTTERDKHKRELQERRGQLEEEYRKRMSALSERERSLSSSVKTEFESVQRETYQQRQLLLQQTEQVRQKEHELRVQKEHMSRVQVLNEEKLEKMEQLLRRREEEVHEKELHLENTLKLQQERVKMDEKIAYDTKYREVSTWEASLKDKMAALEREKQQLLSNNERRELIEKRQRCDELESHSRKYQIEVASLEMKVSGLQDRLAKVYDYDVIRDSNVSLKKDLELTKERLDTIMRENSVLREKNEQTLMAARERPGASELLMIKSQLQRERDKAVDDKVVLEHRLREMEEKFQDQLRKNQMLVLEFEHQTDRQKRMNQEYSERLTHDIALKDAVTVGGKPFKRSLTRDVSFFDTSFTKTIPPELALDADWLEQLSGGEVSTATEESLVKDTRKRLQHLEAEAENLQAAFQFLTNQRPGSPRRPASPRRPKSLRDTKSLQFPVAGNKSCAYEPAANLLIHRAEGDVRPFRPYSEPSSCCTLPQCSAPTASTAPPLYSMSTGSQRLVGYSSDSSAFHRSPSGFPRHPDQTIIASSSNVIQVPVYPDGQSRSRDIDMKLEDGQANPVQCNGSYVAESAQNSAQYAVSPKLLDDSSSRALSLVTGMTTSHNVNSQSINHHVPADYSQHMSSQNEASPTQDFHWKQPVVKISECPTDMLNRDNGLDLREQQPASFIQGEWKPSLDATVDFPPPQQKDLVDDKQAAPFVEPTMSLDAVWKVKTIAPQDPKQLELALDDAWKSKAAIQEGTELQVSLDDAWKAPIVPPPTAAEQITSEPTFATVNSGVKADENQIDPVMQKYMDLIKKQKEEAQAQGTSQVKEQSPATEELSAEDLSITKSEISAQAVSEEEFW